MSTTNYVTKAISIAGKLSVIANACGVSHQAVRKWEATGLPRTEWTGETNHAEKISMAVDGKVTKKELLAVVPEKKRAGYKARTSTA